MKIKLTLLTSAAAMTIVAASAQAQGSPIPQAPAADPAQPPPQAPAADPTQQPAVEGPATTVAPAIAESSAEADQRAAGGLQDVVVTARRTEERLQDVPVSVTGFNAAQIQSLQISSFADIGKMVPNLDVQRQFGSASAPQFFLRGVATGSLKFEQDAGIGLYIDGVYLGRPAGTAFDLADIQRIEVLRGPQGTLFGRNSTGGAINYITAPPSGKFGVRASGTVGNFEHYKGQVTVDLPALGPLSARVSYLHNQNKGYVDNLTPGRVIQFAQPFGRNVSADSFGDENTEAVGVAVRLDLNPFVLDYKFDYTDKTSTQLAPQLLGFNPSFAATGQAIISAPGSVVVGPSTVRQDAIALDSLAASRLKIQGHSLTANYDITDDISIKSISAYRKLDENVGGNDIDGGALVDPFAGTGLPFTYISSVEDRHQEQVSEEFQLLGKAGSFNWLLGGFYFRETGRDNNPVFLGALFPDTTIVPSTGPGTGNTINLFGVPSDYLAGTNVTIRNRSIAGYAHLDYKTDRFELAGGVRYTKDDRRETVLAAGLTPFVTPAATYNASNDHWDFDATGTLIFNRNVRAYLRFATGYLSGGVLGGIPFNPETVQNYEAGLKGDFLNNTFRLNAAVFHTERRNVQTLSFSAASGSFIISAPTGKETGFELEATAVPTDGLTIGTSFGYLDDKLSDDPITGLPVQSLAPKYTLSNNIQYDLPRFSNDSYVTFRIDGFFKSRRFSDPLRTPGTVNLTTLPARYDLNARISLVDLPIAGSKVRVSGWVQNLTDNKNLEFARDLSTAVIGVFQVPRTYGLDLGLKF